MWHCGALLQLWCRFVAMMWLCWCCGASCGVLWCCGAYQDHGRDLSAFNISRTLNTIIAFTTTNLLKCQKPDKTTTYVQLQNSNTTNPLTISTTPIHQQCSTLLPISLPGLVCLLCWHWGPISYQLTPSFNIHCAIFALQHTCNKTPALLTKTYPMCAFLP